MWADFVTHANACYKDAFWSAFSKPFLRCVGPPHGGACPRNFHVDLTCARAYAMLGELHLDHEQDVVVTCDMWVQALAGRRRRRRAAVQPSLLGARQPGAQGGDAALPLRSRARTARHQDQLLVPQAQHAALPRPARRRTQRVELKERRESWRKRGEMRRSVETSIARGGRRGGHRAWGLCVAVGVGLRGGAHHASARV